MNSASLRERHRHLYRAIEPRTTYSEARCQPPSPPTTSPVAAHMRLMVSCLLKWAGSVIQGTIAQKDRVHCSVTHSSHGVSIVLDRRCWRRCIGLLPFTVQIKPGRRVTRHKALLLPNFGPLSLVTGPATACDTPQDPLFGRYTAKLGNSSPPPRRIVSTVSQPEPPADLV